MAGEAAHQQAPTYLGPPIDHQKQHRKNRWKKNPPHFVGPPIRK